MWRKTAVLAFFISAACSAQTNKFAVGVSGGPNLISLRGNEIIKQYQKPAVSFVAGLFFQYQLKKRFSVLTNISYEKKGAVSTATAIDQNGNPTGTYKTNTNFQYLVLPLLIRVSFGKKTNLFLNAGPYSGYLLKQTFATKLNGATTMVNDNTNLDKRFDFGVSAGAGLWVPIKQKFRLLFEVRDNLGLYNVSKAPVVNKGTVKTNSVNFSVSFAYLFGSSDNSETMQHSK